MFRSITLLVWILCVGCSENREMAKQSVASEIKLDCMVVQLEPRFLTSLGGKADPPILNDIETFFLLACPAGTKSKPSEFYSGETIRLSDTFGSGNVNEFVRVTGVNVDGSTRLTVASDKGSTILLDSDLVVELPKFGSTIIKATNPTVDGRSTCLWVMARH